jgi:hypothetical protein
VAATLSDRAWADICAAAGRTPHAEVRNELSTVLFDEYPAFAYGRERRERTAVAYKRAQRMLKHLDAFAIDHRAQFTRVDEILTERDRFYIERLRWRTHALLDVARAIRRANARHSDVQREVLYTRLCTLWLYRWGASKLSYSRSSGGGAPHGPLIAFILTCMRQIMSEDALPSPSTVAHAIERERVGREPVEGVLRRARNIPS